MSKCGSTIPSIVLSNASRFLLSSSRRVSIVLARSSTRFCTTWFGCRFSACSGAAATRSRQSIEYTKRMIEILGWVLAASLLAVGLGRRLIAGFFARLVACLAGIATDQVLAD